MVFKLIEINVIVGRVRLDLFPCMVQLSHVLLATGQVHYGTNRKRRNNQKKIVQRDIRGRNWNIHIQKINILSNRLGFENGGARVSTLFSSLLFCFASAKGKKTKQKKKKKQATIHSCCTDGQAWWNFVWFLFLPCRCIGRICLLLLGRSFFFSFI